MTDHGLKKVIIIAGPTASGKTAVSIELANYFQTDIISCDSRQCYREMRIGTAAPSPEEQQGIRHFFIQSHSIHQPVSAGKFKELASDWLNDIFKERDVAIITGGTGLYIQTLTEGIHELPEISAATRAKIKNDYTNYGLVFLQQYVASNDPDYFSRADIMNPARLMRAAEIISETGLSYSSFLKKEKEFTFPYELHKFVIDLDREVLYHRINNRVDAMIENGLVAEVKSLYASRNLSTLSTVGYSEIFEYLDGKWSLEAAIEKIKQHSRNYAKRQLTWFRNKGDYHFANPAELLLKAKNIFAKH